MLFAEAGLFQKAVKSRPGRIRFGAFEFFLHIALFGRKVCDRKGQPARAGESLDAFKQQATVGESAHHQTF